MPKLTIFLFLFVHFTIVLKGQPQKHPVVVNEQFQVVNYEYEYLFVEFATSVSFSTFFPIFNTDKPTDKQLFFEGGRNKRLGFDAGFLQSIKIENWFLRTGIEYQLINENFIYGEYDIREVEIQNNNGSTEKIIVAVGEPIMLSHLNRLGYLKVPLQLGYLATIGKTEMEINTGINFHYLLTSNYQSKFSINQALETIPIDDFNSSYLSLTIGLNVSKNFNRFLKIQAGPFYNFGLDKIIEQEDLSYRMSCIGIKFVLAIDY